MLADLTAELFDHCHDFRASLFSRTAVQAAIAHLRPVNGCDPPFYFIGVSVKYLMASPYCGGRSRQKLKVFWPCFSWIVTGWESCHMPTV